MPEYKSPGQLAYEGFSQKSGGKSVITSEPLPTWGAQIQALKDSWEAAAAAVNTAQNVEAPKPLSEPIERMRGPVEARPGTPFYAEEQIKPVPEPAKAPVKAPVEAPKDQFASYRAATEPKPAVTQTMPVKPEPPKGPVSQPPLKPKTF